MVRVRAGGEVRGGEMSVVARDWRKR